MWTSLIAQLVKNPPAMQETPVRFLGQKDPLKKGKVTHSSILALPLWLSWWRICLQWGRLGFYPWVGKNPWKSERLPTPVFWPRGFLGLYSPWGHEELDMTEQLSLLFVKGLFVCLFFFFYGLSFLYPKKVYDSQVHKSSLQCFLKKFYTFNNYVEVCFI